MSMDALALLNALDVIRNEGVYQERLNALAEAQAKLDTSQYIVETVEVANVRLDEANRLLEKHREMLEKADKDIEELRITRLADVAKLEAKLNDRQNSLGESEKRLKREREVLEQERAAVAKTQAQLAYSVADYDARRIESQKVIEDYSKKVEQLRTIIGI